MHGSVPEGWPKGVRPPGVEGYEQSAIVWLFDQVPSDYRVHGILRRYPLALARMAREHMSAALDAARQGYRTARVQLSEAGLPPHAVEEVMGVYVEEGSGSPRRCAPSRSSRSPWLDHGHPRSGD